ncbi:hypothetical protein LJK88_12670 [Paenibacillus sp. P26]|nr:hypothetical protein LJK88_12670 [Paenibacillus sp. P26]
MSHKSEQAKRPVSTARTDPTAGIKLQTEHPGFWIPKQLEAPVLMGRGKSRTPGLAVTTTGIMKIKSIRLIRSKSTGMTAIIIHLGAITIMVMDTIIMAITIITIWGVTGIRKG